MDIHKSIMDIHIDIHNSVYGYPQFYLWISIIRLWISMIRYVYIHNSFIDIHDYNALVPDSLTMTLVLVRNNSE